jgi:thymidine kinase
MSKNRIGKLFLIIGPMGGGKTTRLIQQYERYALAGRKCIMLKPIIDTRSASTKVTTHKKRFEADAIPCHKLADADPLVKEVDVVCIDELQFFGEDGSYYCKKWADEGKIVEGCGLNGTSDQEHFPGNTIPDLLPHIDGIEFLPAVCEETGKDAPFTACMVPKDSPVAIGGMEMYKPVDREVLLSLKTKSS